MNNNSFDINHLRSLSSDLMFINITQYFGTDIYLNPKQLVGVLSDIINQDEAKLRLFRRSIFDDEIPQKLYKMYREFGYDSFRIHALTNQFAKNNTYSLEVAKEVVEALLMGLDVRNLTTESRKYKDTWTDEFGVVYSADRTALINGERCPRSYVVKEGTLVICNNAFQFINTAEYFEGAFIENITLPNSLVKIGKNAFIGSLFLNEITLPHSLQHIESYAFLSSRLKKINILSGVKIIDDFAFSDCINLEFIELPYTLEKISNTAFDRSINLKSIKVSDNNQFYMSDNGVLYTKSKEELIIYPNNKTDSHFEIP